MGNLCDELCELSYKPGSRKGGEEEGVRNETVNSVPEGAEGRCCLVWV